MTKSQGWLALILALAIGSVLVLRSLPLSLGLDLRGGSQLTLLIKPAGAIKKIEPNKLEAVKDVLERRVNGLGVSEATVTSSGDDKIIVQLPGVQDPRKAAEVLGTTAMLEFRAQKPDTEQEMTGLMRLKRLLVAKLDQLVGRDKKGPDVDKSLNELLKSLDLNSPEGASEQQQLEAILADTNRRIVSLFEAPAFTGTHLIDAGRQQQPNSQAWEVTLRFDRIGGDEFAALTKSIAGTNRLLGIMLDGNSISEASVGPQFATAGITGGSASITGQFTAEQARNLEVQLRGGALPLPVEIIENRSVGPTLGAENVRNSLVAAVLGIALVGVFMIVIYRVPGFVAVLALCLYALYNLAIYALIPVTLTLPGIAGFILSVGMAVDANILIFERTKEELQDGNSLFRSVEAGFSRAFSSIFDGHLTTLISCAALGWLGTGLVRGFAITLAVGVLLSLFTALTCSRTLLRLVLSYPALRKPEFFLGSPSHP
ncbi:protein translocase subunit SecD [Synechococcus sp. UW140]|uniref:protein translocase subunit SecD n=1 Tax=Synechococcus sp. UW140 TaxID=368503 RepID=UPI0025FD2F89|nr:protein translocase subunit SecD [Synechococcus sp. UW140]